jgi:putative polymerase
MSSVLSELVLIGAVCFNAILAIINGHVFALQRVHVVLAEIVIYATALSLIGFNADRRMMPWFLLALFIILFGLLLALGNGAFNAKYLRDVLVIPIFVMLGMTYHRATLLRPLLILQTIVFLVAVLEAVLPGAYAEVFRILEYYVNTRDFSESQFWNADSTLFISATRPGERFFGFVELHRLSSIFLEPVSLGNYCVVMAIAVIAFWRELRVWARVYLTASILAILIGCDGRLAAASILIIVILVPLLSQLPSRWSVMYLPLVLIASAGYVWFFNRDAAGDTFGGRLAGSLLTLSEMDLSGLLGFDAISADRGADSGIAYFLFTQSFIGVAIIWLSICLVPDGRDYQSRIYVHAISVFIPLNLMVSYSFFSIKVASLMWFCYGFIFMKSRAYDASVDRDGTLRLPAVDVAA